MRRRHYLGNLINVQLFSIINILGFNLVGAWSNPLDIAPNFVGTIMGITGMFSYLTGAMVPHTVSIMSSVLGSQDQVWTALFLLVSGKDILHFRGE